MGWWTQNKLARTNEWIGGVGLVARKLAQKTMVGLDMPSSLSNENLQMVCLVHQLSLGGDLRICPTLLMIGEVLLGRENKAILPTYHEITTYVCEIKL